MCSNLHFRPISHLSSTGTSRTLSVPYPEVVKTRLSKLLISDTAGRWRCSLRTPSGLGSMLPGGRGSWGFFIFTIKKPIFCPGKEDFHLLHLGTFQSSSFCELSQLFWIAFLHIHIFGRFNSKQISNYSSRFVGTVWTNETDSETLSSVLSNNDSHQIPFSRVVTLSRSNPWSFLKNSSKHLFLPQAPLKQVSPDHEVEMHSTHYSGKKKLFQTKSNYIPCL